MAKNRLASATVSRALRRAVRRRASDLCSAQLSKSQLYTPSAAYDPAQVAGQEAGQGQSPVACHGCKCRFPPWVKSEDHRLAAITLNPCREARPERLPPSLPDLTAAP